MTEKDLVDPSRLGANEPCWCGSGRKFKRCHKPSTDRVAPRKQSATRAVPDSIELPPYALTGGRSVPGEPDVKSTELIEAMRRTGAAAADILAEVGAAIAPGVTTDELDEICHEACIAAGGYPSPLNYSGFPKSLCTSVNEVICHGIPDSRELRDGDIVNLDVTLFREGVHGDTNATWGVGTIDPLSQKLIDVTRQCLELGIEQVEPGAKMNSVGHAIQGHAEANGFGVVRAFIGHGIGETFHTDLQIMHYYDPGDMRRFQEGMTFTIEPMISLGDWRHRIWDDDWTAVTVDGKRTAQFEHTMVVTADGVELLTLREDGLWSGDGRSLAGQASAGGA